MRINTHTSIGMTPGTAMDWETIAREGTLMSVRAVRQELLLRAHSTSRSGRSSFLFERFSFGALVAGTWFLFFFFLFPFSWTDGTSFGKHPIVGIE
jgi:hypothetical protein